MSQNRRDGSTPIPALDLFCGVGGSSWGAKDAGAKVVAGFDMWALAGKTYRDNFPEAKFYRRKLEFVNPKKIRDELGKIDLMLASPECTNHSPARGDRLRSEESQKTAYQVIRFARAFTPRWIVIENVVSMKSWERYDYFLGRLKHLGYNILEQTINAAEFGVPQARRRLFIICDRDREPTEVTPPASVEGTCARSVINFNGKYRFTELDKPGRAAATLERAGRAIEALGQRSKFLLVYYGSDGAGGWQPLDVPLRTVTTLDRFALVRPSQNGHEMRMLQVPEIRAAMGFPPEFKLEHGSRRDRIHLLGNAVCPPVVKAIVGSLTHEMKEGERG